MNHSNVTACILGLLVVIGLTGLIFSSPIVSATTSNDETPPAPELEACPDDFLDEVGVVSATGQDDDLFIAALGEAIQACNALAGRENDQQIAEMKSNRAKCEAVAGCTLKYKIWARRCTGDHTSCTTEAGQGDEGPFSCKVVGGVDLHAYRCDRTVVSDPVIGQTGEVRIIPKQEATPILGDSVASPSVIVKGSNA
ncbi:MAG: hypothetical protein AABY11_03595 [archaeon]